MKLLLKNFSIRNYVLHFSHSAFLFFLFLAITPLESVFANSQISVKAHSFADLYNKHRVGQSGNPPWTGNFFPYETHGTAILLDQFGYPFEDGRSPLQMYDKLTKSPANQSSHEWEKQKHSCDHLSDNDKKSCQSWWGHCNGWSAAAIKVPEPRSSVKIGNEVLSVAEQKAIYTELWLSSYSIFSGNTHKGSPTGSWIFGDQNSPDHIRAKAFWDTTPRLFILILTQYVGALKQGVVIDRFTGDEVWNQPLLGYRILPIKPGHQTKIEQDGQSLWKVDLTVKIYWANDLGVMPGAVTTEFDIFKDTSDTPEVERIPLTEGVPHHEGRALKLSIFLDQPLTFSDKDGLLQGEGQIIGDGYWEHSVKPPKAYEQKYFKYVNHTHPDFFWIPTNPLHDVHGNYGNPYVTAEKVEQLFKSSQRMPDSITPQSHAQSQSHAQAHAQSHAQANPQPNRMVQSVTDLIQGPKDLLKIIKSNQFNQASCSQQLFQINSNIFNLPSEYYYPATQDESQSLVLHGNTILDELSELQLAIKNKFQSFSKPSADCLSQTRRSLRFIRFAQDSIILFLASQNKVNPQEPETSFDALFPRIIYNKSLFSAPPNSKSLKTGDAILMRGDSFTSAVIARVGDDMGQFSHLGMIAEDANGKQYLAESLIETGMIVTPLDEWLKKREIRLVVYRHKNPETAKNAGRKIYDHFLNIKNKNERLNGNPDYAEGVIPYDFTMNSADHSTLYCAETVQYAFELAQIANPFPKFPSTMNHLSHSSFLKNIGVTINQAFAPSDIDLDPSFEFAFEFRRIKELSKVSSRDSVSDYIYKMIIHQHYDFIDDPLYNDLSVVLSELVSQYDVLKDKIPKHMPRSAIVSVIQFYKLFTLIELHLTNVQEKYESIYNHPMSYQERLQTIELFRAQDCRSFMTRKTSLFHSFFRPKECNPNPQYEFLGQ